MRFSADKFTGVIGESCNEYVAKYLHKIMGGAAKRFFLDVDLHNVSNFNQAVELIGH